MGFKLENTSDFSARRKFDYLRQTGQNRHRKAIKSSIKA
jgi:hypothetical protein